MWQITACVYIYALHFNLFLCQSKYEAFNSMVQINLVNYAILNINQIRIY